MRYIVGFLISFLLSPATQAASSLGAYEDVLVAFETAAAVKPETITGYWSGRCLKSENPDKVIPGLFASREIQTSAETYFSFSYYWNENWPESHFDHWTLNNIDNNPEVQQWFKEETWNPTTFQGVSWINYYEPSVQTRFKREVRKEMNEFEERLLLKVTRISGDYSNVSSLCYFNKKIANFPEPHVTHYEIRITNRSSGTVRYNFRFAPHHQWSQQTLGPNQYHAWNEWVSYGSPIIRFDSSYLIGYQMKQYNIHSGHFSFVPVSFGVDLVQETSAPPQ